MSEAKIDGSERGMGENGMMMDDVSIYNTLKSPINMIRLLIFP